MPHASDPVMAAVDVGGTKIATALVADGQITRRLVRPTPAEGGLGVVSAIIDQLAELSAGRRLRAVGVGAPGTIDAASGAVRSATDVLPNWAGVELGRLLIEALGLPVVVENDVRVMALAEARTGAGHGFDEVLAVSVGTGIGGALVRSGRLVTGAHGTAGELAHLLVTEPGAVACGCGAHWHLEAVTSGPAIVAAYHAAGGRPAGGLPEIAARSAAGEPLARQAIAHAAQTLGGALAGLLNVIDVDAVVIGGGVAQLGPVLGADRGPRYVDAVIDAIRAQLLPPLHDLVIRPALHGTDAPLLGAAMLAQDQLSRTSQGDAP